MFLVCQPRQITYVLPDGRCRDTCVVLLLTQCSRPLNLLDNILQAPSHTYLDGLCRNCSYREPSKNRNATALHDSRRHTSYFPQDLVKGSVNTRTPIYDHGGLKGLRKRIIPSQKDIVRRTQDNERNEWNLQG